MEFAAYQRGVGVRFEELKVLVNVRGGSWSFGLSWQRCSLALQRVEWELKLKGELGQLAHPPEEPV